MHIYKLASNDFIGVIALILTHSFEINLG